MYRLNKIQDSLLHLVGWEQSRNPNDLIDEALTETESGLTFQGIHPLVTFENIKAIMPSDYTLSEYLERITQNGIAMMVQEFITTKKLAQETRSLLDRRTFFDGAGRFANTINNQNRIVGYELNPIRSMGVTVKINRIGLQMRGAMGTVKLYIFHSNMTEPYWTKEVEITNTDGTFQWFEIKDLYLPYIADNKNAGGSWFLCYSQAELPQYMEAINMTKDWSSEPCGGCNSGNPQLWRELTKYIRISPFKTTPPSDFVASPEMWDIEKNIYTNTVNYGINVEISVECDLTDFIIRQRSMFQDALQVQVAMNVLREIAMNPDARVNKNQNNAAQGISILYEIDGDSRGHEGGLKHRLDNIFRALKLDTQGIDRICLSCNNYGVNYTSI